MKEINEFEEKIWDFVTMATGNRDFNKIKQLTPIAQDLELIKAEAEKIRLALGELEERLDKLALTDSTGELRNSVSIARGRGGRSICWEVTAGALAQNILSTVKVRKAGLIPTDGSQFEVETSLGQIFRSAELPKERRLRDGEEIREFYEGAGIEPGDFVRWTEVAPFRYRLEKTNREKPADME